MITQDESALSPDGLPLQLFNLYAQRLGFPPCFLQLPFSLSDAHGEMPGPTATTMTDYTRACNCTIMATRVPFVVVWVRVIVVRA